MPEIVHRGARLFEAFDLQDNLTTGIGSGVLKISIPRYLSRLGVTRGAATWREGPARAGLRESSHPRHRTRSCCCAAPTKDLRSTGCALASNLGARCYRPSPAANARSTRRQGVGTVAATRCRCHAWANGRRGATPNLARSGDRLPRPAAAPKEGAFRHAG